MKNKFEHFLLSLLLGTSTLLGLSFWLNVNYGFNLFYREHWDILAKLQATQTPINRGFYVSIIVAILIFVIGVYIIYRPRFKQKQNPITPQDIKNNTQPSVAPSMPVAKTETMEVNPSVPVPNTLISRPPRLNLPSNMAQIAAQRQQDIITNKPPVQNQPEQNPYTSTISQIFSDNGYAIKPNPKISGFTPNLFAIGPNEVLWIGAIDTKPEDLIQAVEKLQSVFQETLEDIQINITAFILDTLNQYQSNDSILIFKSTDELKNFISENPADTITDEERDNFDSYSEYIDTVIQYIKNI